MSFPIPVKVLHILKSLVYTRTGGHRQGRSSMAAAAITHSLPEDIVVDILARLPVKSLKRFRCVGHCNGIICLCDCVSGILLWNIATKEFKILPMCPFECPPSYENTIDVVYPLECPPSSENTIDVYKVIRIDTFWEGDFDKVPRGNRVALYNLTTDSWRKLNDNLTAEFFHSYRNYQVYSNGFYHCLADVDSEELLLSFDMSNEVFVTTPFPDGRLDGCYDVWVLGELGLKNSWTKLFTIESLPPATTPLGVGSDGEIFFVNEESNFLAWHHGDNKEIKTLQFDGTALELAFYAESLVSFRGGTAFNH
ncbi:F-box protein CPR30-like [Durio zibethinus]|uniref:F-box protein CPR30-like n=1 Tax=Durio zibethinus TaxID=66656 RepID=A0A6P5YNK5_DURZI|nr:F-box protein CPR30-like [Durio zibethinus]